MDMFIFLYIIIFAYNVWAFMYQRTALETIRKADKTHLLLQTDLMPSTTRIMVAVGGFIIYPLHLYVGWQYGILWGLGSLAISLVIAAIIPIPYRYFEKKINAYMDSKDSK